MATTSVLKKIEELRVVPQKTALLKVIKLLFNKYSSIFCNKTADFKHTEKATYNYF